MKDELEQKLLEKYPAFFEYLKDYKGPMMPISFGFECGDGWFVIIDNLMDSINNYIQSKKKYPDKQIKSKFWRFIVGKYRHRCHFKSFMWVFFNKLDKWLTMEIIPAPQVNITQVKEKFGGLRFYYDGGDDFIDGMVQITENLSYQTCEICGSTKEIGSTRGWITTICQPCFDSGKTNSKEWKSKES